MHANNSDTNAAFKTASKNHHNTMRFNDLGIKYLTPPSSKARETYVT